jgi:UPF0755 protein
VSNLGLGFSDETDDGAEAYAEERPRASRADRGGNRRADRRSGGRFRGCLPMILAIVVVVAGIWFGGGWAVDKVKSLVGENADYSGPGSGSVTIQVHEGDTSAAIGRALKEAGVVKSVGAFTDAAVADERSRSIQVGYYQLKKEMKASEALAILVDPKNLIQARVTIPEGYRVKDVVKAIVSKTDISAAQLNAALKNPKALGLPAVAGGKIEGYLFPATYTVVPGENAKQLLTKMVAKTLQVQEELDLTAKAQALGYTPEEIMTLASILEYEGSRPEDLDKIARVFYNRLDEGMALQSDATVAYANNLQGTVWTTQEQRDNPSPYNTYVHPGLPPGPIGSPGQKTLEAALNPADGDWLYFVPINLKTGETAFAETFAEHQANVAKLKDWCRETDSPNCD